MTNYFETSAKIVLNFPCRIRQGGKIYCGWKVIFHTDHSHLTDFSSYPLFTIIELKVSILQLYKSTVPYNVFQGRLSGLTKQQISTNTE